MANKINHPKKQFCVNGHNVTICGRDKRGHCKDCRKEFREQHKEEIRSQRQKYYDENKEKIKQYQEDHKEEIIEQQKKRYEEKKDELNAQSRAYYEVHRNEIIAQKRQYQRENVDAIKRWIREHRKEINERQKQYNQEHPEVAILANLKNKTNRGLRVVIWGQEGIKEFYHNCPMNKEVDHYIPLQGDEVSGLHVNWNLQYLTPSENRTKRNQTDLTKISEWYGQILQQAGLK